MPKTPSAAFAALKKLLATRQNSHPCTRLVAFVDSEDLQRITFVTSGATTEYRNLTEAPDVSLLIDSRTHSFARSPSTAPRGVKVVTSTLVTHFQHVV